MAIYVKRHAGRLGELMLRIGELMVGPDLSSVSGDGPKSGKLKNKRLTQWSKPPTEKEEAQVKRELTENCIVSEILSSMALFTIIATDMALDAARVPGHGAFLHANSTTINLSDDEVHKKRLNALAVYTVILCCQIVGIFIS